MGAEACHRSKPRCPKGDNGQFGHGLSGLSQGSGPSLWGQEQRRLLASLPG